MKVIGTSGVLRWKTQTNGIPRLQGIFAMKDQQGFPVDMSYEIAKEKGWDIDWIEALCDALRQCILKYDALFEEIKMLVPDQAESIERMFGVFLMEHEGPTASDKAQHMYSVMRPDMVKG